MQICPNCKHQNRPGVVFCDHCGASLIGEASLGTRTFGGKTGGTGSLAKGPTPPNQPQAPIAGTQNFMPFMILRLVMDSGLSLTVEPTQEMILGRRDPATGAQPDIDLTPYAGYRMGVSRRHAAIRRGSETSLELWDLGSSNGTFLNGNKLVSYRPNRIHDGDEIRLGQMAMRVYFEFPDGLRPKAPGRTTQTGSLPGTGSLPSNGVLPGTGSLSSNSVLSGTGSLSPNRVSGTGTLSNPESLPPSENRPAAPSTMSPSTARPPSQPSPAQPTLPPNPSAPPAPRKNTDSTINKSPLPPSRPPSTNPTTSTGQIRPPWERDDRKPST
jgi:hypothetical protein